MTPKQAQRLIKKIADIKRALAAQKRRFGGYDDSRGLRYIPTRYYIQLAAYKGGLAYTRWFAKSFTDDNGFPDFLFKWSILLFKANKIAEAKAKVWLTFCANTYVLDKFLGHPLQSIPKYEWLTWLKLVLQHISPSRISNPSYLISGNGWRNLWPASSS